MMAEMFCSKCGGLKTMHGYLLDCKPGCIHDWMTVKVMRKFCKANPDVVILTDVEIGASMAVKETLAAAIKVVKKLRDEDKARYAGYPGYRNGDYAVVLAKLKEMEAKQP